jgi:hypothetical protein
MDKTPFITIFALLIFGVTAYFIWKYIDGKAANEQTFDFNDINGPKKYEFIKKKDSTILVYNIKFKENKITIGSSATSSASSTEINIDPRFDISFPDFIPGLGGSEPEGSATSTSITPCASGDDRINFSIYIGDKNIGKVTNACYAEVFSPTNGISDVVSGLNAGPIEVGVKLTPIGAEANINFTIEIREEPPLKK